MGVVQVDVPRDRAPAHGRKGQPRIACTNQPTYLPAFGDALKSRRCLIPADGFYEWAKTGKGKQPYCFEVNEGELFAFAGLWDRWKDPSGNWVKTCSILTTTPN